MASDRLTDEQIADLEAIGDLPGYARALLAEVRAARGLTPPPETPACTGLTARWCPAHGACSCDERNGLDDPACPLHRWDSNHPAPAPPPETRECRADHPETGAACRLPLGHPPPCVWPPPETREAPVDVRPRCACTYGLATNDRGPWHFVSCSEYAPPSPAPSTDDGDRKP